MSATPSRDPVRPEIRAFRSYSLSKGPEIVRAKLDFNESPLDVPGALKRQVLERLAARRWAHYPEFGARRLKEAIARAFGRAPEEIVVGNGSGEVILGAITVLAGCGGTLVLAPPTFSLYAQLATISGAALELVPCVGPAFELDEEAFLAAAARDGRDGCDGRTVPLLCSPNNPTGGVVSRDSIRRLASAAAVVLLDQAYVDFAAPEDDALPLLDELPNLVVFRTLSKAYSAAGFRIGFAVAKPDLAREIEKAVLPFNVDIAAEELALALLADPVQARGGVAVVLAERERVVAGLKRLGAAVVPSAANFLLFAPPGGEARRVREALLARGVLVRDMTGAVPGHLRVSIGAPAENDVFLAELEASL